MKQLHNTIQRLTSNPNKSVTVTNMETTEKIVSNKKGSALIEEYGSVEAFFESLYQNGITKIRVADRNPSGTSSTPCGEPYTISLVPNEDDEDLPDVKTKATVPAQKQPVMPVLNGSFDAIGLNAAQIDAAGKLYDYPRVVSELQSAKSKNERLEAENQELKMKILINDTMEGKTVAKTEANAKLLEQAVPLLGMVMQKLAPVPATPQGLASPSLPPQQQRVVVAISQYDEDTAYHVANFLELLMDEQVWSDFEHLLTKNNLIQANGKT